VNLPVVFLTSHADPTYEKLAFERGALDFIDKTRGVEILASRLRLAVKSGKPAATPEAENPIICGKLILSPSTGRRANVPLSSRPMMREWPTTSAVTIAASLRCSRTTGTSPVVLQRIVGSPGLPGNQWEGRDSTIARG